MERLFYIMVKSRKDVLILLKVLEDMLENLGATEYQGLIAGEGYLVYEPKKNLYLSQGKSESMLKEKGDSSQHEISVEEFIPKLLAAKTKEEAQLIIPQRLKKAILLEIASVLSVHVQKRYKGNN